MRQAPTHADVRRAVEGAARRRPGVVGGMTSGADRLVVGAGRVRSPAGPVPTDTTLFEIGSVTKVVTALLLADACVRGEVSLHTPLQEVLPEVAVPSRDGAISLLHLATHTAGLPRLPMPWREVVRLELTRHPDPYSTLREEHVLSALEGTRLRRAPGEGRMRYSNFGAGLLGLALVRAARAASYAELVQARVCGPLGMTDTVVDRTSDQRARSARGHRGRAGRRQVADWTFPGIPGAGALWSTAADLLRFLDVQLSPDDHPLGEAVRMMQRDHGVTRMTLGWMVHGPPGGRRLLWHNGGTGGFRSFVGFSPEARTGVVVLANGSRSVDRTGLTLAVPLLR